MRTSSLAGIGPLVLAAVTLACTGPVRSFAEPTGAASGSGSGGGQVTSTGAGAGGAGAGSSGTGGTGGTGGSANSCEDAKHTCVPDTPVGWSGPVVFFEGPSADQPPACIGDYGTTAGEYHGGLDGGTPDCLCTCNPATGIVCNGASKLCYDNGMCILACVSPDLTLTPGVCTNMPMNASSASVSSPTPTDMGSCVSAANHVIPTPAWTTNAKACGGAPTTPTGCGAGETCAIKALTAFDKLCVVQSGDVACPDAYYADKHVVFENFTDTRVCSSCSCGAATSKCGGEVAFTQGGCSNILVSVLDAGSCGAKNNGGSQPNNALYNPKPTGTCPPAGGALSGSVGPTGGVTFCCH